MIQAAIFYLLAGATVLAGIMVISARNPVHSVLWLIFAFVNAAGLFLVIGAEFLAMLLVIVYVGAVAVLFLFVVMMLDIDFATLRAGAMRYLPLGLLLGAALSVELLLVASAWEAGAIAPSAPPRSGLSNTQALGTLLYTDYVFVFQAAGLILLTAMVGAIVLTHRERAGVKRQDPFRQASRTPAETIALARPAVGAGVETEGGVR
ncbi:MAG: NADH-quinone oxidoreductase subunit J [Thermaurantiacus tibetensis]|uniref:NADH-quinone oxidoreductase subunit J n=1 Tax=Thermaurantiacus tibetensis TaxID=2759035 RepID=UPI00188FDC20|nr:NADH-quinone oxidoreductase subunit J [Thermaurantiacus tibetensis]